MILDALRTFSSNPSAVVGEPELINLLSTKFDLAVELGIVVPTDRWARHVIREERVLTVEELPSGDLEAADELDPEFAPIALTAADVAEWALDPLQLARAVALVESLEPRPEHLGHRFVQVASVRRNLPLVVGLLADDTASADALLAMRARLPLRIRGVIVASPAYRPTAADSVALERHSILVAQLAEDLRVRPSLQACAVQLTEAAPLGTLEPESGFLLSADCRTATLGARQFGFSGREGSAVAVLLRAYMAGQPWMHQGTLLAEIESDSAELKSLFKRNPAFGTLVVGDGEGRFRLNFASD